MLYKTKLKTMENKRFEIGKAYEHNCGSQLYICGMADTVFYGTCFIAENGWNREKLAERNAAIPREIERGQKVPIGGYGINGWGELFTPISMSVDASVNYHEITKEEFVKNNTAK